MYLNNGGSSWSNKADWMGSSNHCDWQGVTCTTSNVPSSIALDNNQLSGSYPSDLINLQGLSSLNLSANSLVGLISNDLCDKSISDNLDINGKSCFVLNCLNVLPIAHIFNSIRNPQEIQQIAQIMYSLPILMIMMILMVLMMIMILPVENIVLKTDAVTWYILDSSICATDYNNSYPFNTNYFILFNSMPQH